MRKGSKKARDTYGLSSSIRQRSDLGVGTKKTKTFVGGRRSKRDLEPMSEIGGEGIDHTTTSRIIKQS